MRPGRRKEALASAQAALRDARCARNARLKALALFRLSEATWRQGDDGGNEDGLERARAAFSAGEALGDRGGMGRALWSCSAALAPLRRRAELKEAGTRALELARETGDLLGMGAVLNGLTNSVDDPAERLCLLNQAMACYEAGGQVERQTVIANNLVGAY